MVANCTINGKHVLAIVDSGSYKTIIDVGMERILGLPIREAVHGDCGTYSVPGTGRNNCYVGVVDQLQPLDCKLHVLCQRQLHGLIHHSRVVVVPSRAGDGVSPEVPTDCLPNS